MGFYLQNSNGDLIWHEGDVKKQSIKQVDENWEVEVGNGYPSALKTFIAETEDAAKAAANVWISELATRLAAGGGQIIVVIDDF